MKTIYYRITLKEPAILTAIDGEPNSAVSYDFIPGAVLRGILIGMYMRANRVIDLADASYQEVTRLFFSDSTRFLNAYPVINNQRSLPIPISWRKAKYGDTNKIYDEAIPPPPDTGKYSSVSGFAITNNRTAYIYQPTRVLNVHTQRARKHADEQLVYRYDALAPNQTFEGIIYCQDTDADGFIALLKDNPHMHIGGARSAGYGKVYIEVVDNEENSYQPEFNQQPEDKHGKLVITLLSDMILRDENGHYAPTLSAFANELKKYFPVHYGANHTTQTTLVGGFNRKWGLPLPQTSALKRGSVIILDTVAIPVNTLMEIYQHGLGARRNEGFGQIAIGWQQHPNLTKSAIEDDKPKPTEENSLSVDGIAMWEKLENRMKKGRCGD